MEHLRTKTVRSLLFRFFKIIFWRDTSFFKKIPLLGITDFVQFRLLQQWIRTVQISQSGRSPAFSGLYAFSMLTKSSYVTLCRRFH